MTPLRLFWGRPKDICDEWGWNEEEKKRVDRFKVQTLGVEPTLVKEILSTGVITQKGDKFTFHPFDNWLKFPEAYEQWKAFLERDTL